jgi:hypothetical protein
MARYAARIENREIVYKMLIVKAKRKASFTRPKRRWNIYLKTDLGKNRMWCGLDYCFRWRNAIVLVIGPKVRGLKPVESDWFLMAIKIRSMTSFGGEVKPSAPCRKDLRHIKDPLRYDRDTDRQNSEAIFHPVSPASLLDVSAVICQRALVD